MKKLFPLIFALLVFAGCSAGKDVTAAVDLAVDPVADVVHPIGKNIEGFISDTAGFFGDSVEILLKPSAGYTYIILALELNANVSSLIIDKTKEKVVGYESSTMKKLTPGSFLFVIPPKITDGETYHYDDHMGRMIRNFLAAGKYGIPVSNPDDAEYIVVTNIRESLSKTYGVNYSEIAFSIMDKLDMPAYAASVRVESRSDRNFWYYATKKARPVKQLTMKGLSHIMAEGLPEAHGEIDKLQAYAQKLTKDKKEN
jgi:hypothetical protein